MKWLLDYFSLARRMERKAKKNKDYAQKREQKDSRKKEKREAELDEFYLKETLKEINAAAKKGKFHIQSDERWDDRRPLYAKKELEAMGFFVEMSNSFGCCHLKITWATPKYEEVV